MARVRILRHCANAWSLNLVFEKLFSKRKKSLKLKLRENSDYRRDEIYLQKSSRSYRVKNAGKSLLKAFVSQKEIYKAMFLKLCASEIFRWAASLFKVLYTNTNFLPKLRKCCHEEMVDNCYKSRVAFHLQVTAKEVITFFLFFCRSAPFRTTSNYFRKLLPGEVVISK